jgi:hypothetical protein
LQRLSQLLKCLADRTSLAPAAIVMMMVVSLLNFTLDVLLQRRVVLLRSRQISGLKILGKLVEGL